MRTYTPDVVVLDIGMPGLDGLGASALLLEHAPSCRPLLLTAMDRRGYLRRALDMGIPGFLLKTTTPERLLDGVRTVAAGGRAIDLELADDF